MAFYKATTIICDVCHQDYDTSESTATDARRDARFDGWVHRDGLDLCPDCAGRP